MIIILKKKIQAKLLFSENHCLYNYYEIPLSEINRYNNDYSPFKSCL